MKKFATAALAALALAAVIPTSAMADDPANPVQGAVCNLYWIEWQSSEKAFESYVATLSSKPAAATFIDTTSEFKPSKKREDVESSQGMWTGWLKQAKAGTYTFTCKSEGSYYSIWINGQKCASAVRGQYSFNTTLEAGFNAVKVIAQSEYGRALTITYKKAGSVKEPVSFGPENMYYDDDE